MKYWCVFHLFLYFLFLIFYLLSRVSSHYSTSTFSTRPLSSSWICQSSRARLSQSRLRLLLIRGSHSTVLRTPALLILLRLACLIQTSSQPAVLESLWGDFAKSTLIWWVLYNFYKSSFFYWLFINVSRMLIVVLFAVATSRVNAIFAFTNRSSTPGPNFHILTSKENGRLGLVVLLLVAPFLW